MRRVDTTPVTTKNAYSHLHVHNAKTGIHYTADFLKLIDSNSQQAICSDVGQMLGLYKPSKLDSDSKVTEGPKEYVEDSIGKPSSAV